MRRSAAQSSRRRRRSWLPALLAASGLLAAAAAPSLTLAGTTGDPNAPSVPRSAGVASDEQLSDSKYSRSPALALEDIVFGTDAVGLKRNGPQCPLDVSLVWSQTLGAGVFATGAVAHLYSDASSGGGKQSIIPGFHRELSILDRDGHHVPGSPLLTESEVYFHASPLLLDFNNDGIRDILWVNVDGTVLVLNGDPAAERVALDDPWDLPKLKVRKDWFKGLDTQEMQKAGPDSKGRKLLEASEFQETEERELDEHHPLTIMRREKGKMRAAKRLMQRVTRMRREKAAAAQQQAESAVQPRAGGRRLLQAQSGLARTRLNRQKARADAEAAAAAAAATPSTPASPTASPTDAAASTPAPAAPTPARTQAEAIVDSADGTIDPEPGVDEPAPVNSALGIPLQRAQDPAAAAVPAAADARVPPPIDVAAAAAAAASPESLDPSLQLPADWSLQGGQWADDQEPLEGGIGGGPDSDTDWYAPGEGSYYDEPGAPPPSLNWGGEADDGWIAGTRPGGAGDDAPASAQELRAALDDILVEEPDFLSEISQQGRGGRGAQQKNGAAGDGGEDPYAAVIQELADKYMKQHRAVLDRQAARQQTGSLEEQQQDDNVSPPVPKSGIASQDAAAVAAAEERRRLSRPASIDTNIERILGDRRGAAGGGGDDLASFFAEQDAAAAALITSQVADGLPDEGRESLGLFADSVLPLGGGGSAKAKGRLRDLDPEVAWELAELDRLYPVLPDSLWLDAHVLATPVLADLDGDARPELVVPVSYFFDAADYANNPSLRARLGGDVDLRNYVAGALLVVDPWTHAVLWREHLDLSTDRTDRRAHLYASPTIVDLDGDGVQEILLPTGMGFIYAFAAGTHKLLRGFPLSMGEIQSPLAVEDINGDGALEIVAIDRQGNVAAFDPAGNEVWHRQISGYSVGGASFGDVDGDGAVDVVVATVSGHLWVLRGKDGSPLEGGAYPLRTDGRIVAPVTLVPLWPEPSTSDKLLAPATTQASRRGLHLVFPSFDGHVYIVEGRSGCVVKLDIGEHVYGQVLVDDILGRGKLDLLVTSMSGNAYLFSTEADSRDHPLRAWSALRHGSLGGNGFAARDGYQGVYLSAHARETLGDVVGSHVEVEYTIVDERTKTRRLAAERGGAVLGSTGAQSSSSSSPPPAGSDVPVRYEVEFLYSGSLVASAVHLWPGVYHRSLPAGETPAYSTFQIRMTNELGQEFEDEALVALNVHFHRNIKYMVITPVIVMCALLIILHRGATPT